MGHVNLNDRNKDKELEGDKLPTFSDITDSSDDIPVKKRVEEKEKEEKEEEDKEDKEEEKKVEEEEKTIDIQDLIAECDRLLAEDKDEQPPPVFDPYIPTTEEDVLTKMMEIPLFEEFR